MSSLAYFLARDTIDHFNTIIKPIVYLSMFYFFNNPRSSILDNYIILVGLVYCVTGIAYAFAMFFQPGSAQLVCSITESIPFGLALSRSYHFVSLTFVFHVAVVGATSCCFNSPSNSAEDFKILGKFMLYKVGSGSICNCKC